MSKQPMFFETTYASDYIRPVANRELALQNESEANLSPSCFSPPLSCTTPVSRPETQPENIAQQTVCGTNQFLPNLCNSHPGVYEELRANTAWLEQAGQSRLKSSYQIDYDHLPEYQLGPYPEDTKYYIRECNGTACSGESCCAEGLCSCQLCPAGGASVCNGRYPDRSVEKPSKMQRSYISSSHWPERPYQDQKKISEYGDRISRLGGIVEKVRLHDHRCCKSPSTCQHNFFLR